MVKLFNGNLAYKIETIQVSFSHRANTKSASFVIHNQGVLSYAMGRPTDDKKDIRINVRINTDLAEKIQQEAFMQNISCSEYIRQKLESEYKKDDGFVIQNDSVSQGFENDLMHELTNISIVSQVSKEQLLSDLKQYVNNDFLYGKNNRLCWNIRKIKEYLGIG